MCILCSFECHAHHSAQLTTHSRQFGGQWSWSKRDNAESLCFVLGPNALVNPSACPQDDMLIRVFNYNTLERVHMFEAHTDYIRFITVHPTQPYILTCSGETELTCTHAPIQNVVPNLSASYTFSFLIFNVCVSR